MDPASTPRTTRRPLLVTVLAVLCLLRVVKDLVDLAVKPADLLVPNHDVQVWFGYRFEGMAAKILTIPHLLIYGYLAYGLFRMTRLGWWVAVLYLLYMPVALLLYMYMWHYATGAAWEVVFVAISLLLIALIEVYLYTHRQLFVR